jgi:hypothetical protein
MNDAAPLNDVQTLNFTILSLMRDAARSDPASACCRFGLNSEQLKAVSELTPADVIQIACSMGNVLLFAPRDDMGALLKAPRTVLPILASARARIPARQHAGHAAA